MKCFKYILFLLVLVSCTSNTIYDKPKNLIPRDSMVALLTDMYIASSAKLEKNKFLKKETNYMITVYEKYKIDSIRFDESNTYYTSKIEDYNEMIEEVKKRLESELKKYQSDIDSIDSLTPKKKKRKPLLRDSILGKSLIKKAKKITRD